MNSIGAMENLLLSWNLPDLVDIFMEQEITPELLPSVLENKILDILVPKIGKRLILENKIKSYLSTRDRNTPDNEIPSSFSSVDVNNLDEEKNIFEIEECFENAPIIVVPSVPSFPICTGQVANAEASLESNLPAKFDLKELLRSTTFGKALINWYQIKGSLDSTRQSYLVDIIATHLINNHITHLSHHDYKNIAKNIIEIFPTEISEAYYLPATRKRDSINNKPGVAKGKLVDKIRNKLTFLRESGILPCRNKDNKNQDQPIVYDTTTIENITWLKHNRQPLEDVFGIWDDLFSDRREKLLKDNNTYNIFSEYPILKKEIGLLLIDRDFKKIFIDKEDSLFEKWETVVTNLIKLRAKLVTSQNDKILIDILEAQHVDIEYKHYVMLTLLASLLPNRSRHLYGKARKHWKPTVADSREGVVLRAEIPAEIEEKIKAKTQKLTHLEIPVQLVVVEGSGTTIRNVYVYINEELYSVPTILKAIDTCFKAYHVLHLRYQIESEHIWFFLQQAIYNVKTKWDAAIPNILDIASKVKNMQ